MSYWRYRYWQFFSVNYVPTFHNFQLQCLSGLTKNLKLTGKYTEQYCSYVRRIGSTIILKFSA
jgi:CRISPR/Cas system CMR-associated protein Cmr5 small subunit